MRPLFHAKVFAPDRAEPLFTWTGETAVLFIIALSEVAPLLAAWAGEADLRIDCEWNGEDWSRRFNAVSHRFTDV